MQDLRGAIALVTGGSGFIGSALIEELLRRGVRVRALLRPTSPLRFLQGLDYHKVIGDLSDEASLEKAVEGVDYVFHLAGCVTASSRQEFMTHNGAGTARLGRAVKKAAPQLKRFIYISSVAAQGPSPTAVPLDETAAPQPISDYGASKLEGERELQGILGSMRLTVLRPPPVYGPRDSGIFQFLKILNKGLLPVVTPSAPGVEKIFSFI